MEKETVTSFSVNVGRLHQLPLDMSLNSFCQHLAKNYQKNTPPSRKLIRGALSAIAFDGQPSDISKDTLYSRILKNTFIEDNSEQEHTTYPHAIYWETQDLLTALCQARSASRNLRDAPLAQKTLDILIERLENSPAEDLASKYIHLQLLREKYIQKKLLEDLSPEIDKRLHIVHMLTCQVPEKVALKTMPLAFEELDSLIVSLAQELPVSQKSNSAKKDPDKTRTQPKDDFVKIICNYYDHLISMRPSVEKSEKETESFKFELAGHDDLMQSLENLLTAWQKELEDKKAKNQKEKNTETEDTEMEGAVTEDTGTKYDQTAFARKFEEYLQIRAENLDRETTDAVKAFAQEYSQLKTYLTPSSWDTVCNAIQEELYGYIKSMFNDIERAEYIPYDYSSFVSNTADSAHIKRLCKRVHNQIGADLHVALRLLQKGNHLYEITNDLKTRFIRSEWKKISPNLILCALICSAFNGPSVKGELATEWLTEWLLQSVFYNPSAPSGRRPEGELAAGQERSVSTVTQGGLLEPAPTERTQEEIARKIIELMLELPLSEWISHATNIRGEFKEKYPKLHFLTPETRELIPNIVSYYNKNIAPLVGKSLDESQISSLLQTTSDSNDNLLPCFCATLYLLRIDCHLIAHSLVEDSLSEIRDIYNYLQKLYSETKQ